MTATTDYGQIVDTTLTDYVGVALQEYGADFDIDAIVGEFRAAIQAQLPEGVTVHGEGILYGPHPRADIDRAAVLDAVDFWAIAERHAHVSPWVDLVTAERAEWLTAMPQLVANGHRLGRTGAVVALTGEALAVLAELDGDHDGHYDGRHIWVGGTAYEVR